jgi:hypothetical protein
MSEYIVTLDVREDLRQGREPFSKMFNQDKKLEHNNTKRPGIMLPALCGIRRASGAGS